jgi:hypothetical protein
MICLSCGFCCKNMSPINGGYCPLLKNDGDIYYCSDHKNRPIECKNHTTPSDVCVVGKNVFGIKTPEEIKQRLKNIRYIINF